MTPSELAKSGTEHAHQTAFFAYCAMAHVYGFDAADTWTVHEVMAKPIPELKWIYAIHNEGHGDVIRGARAKAAGVRKGVADIFLPVPKQHYHGLYIEMKKSRQAPLSSVQIEFGKYALASGYGWIVAYGWRDAANHVRSYLEWTA